MRAWRASSSIRTSATPCSTLGLAHASLRLQPRRLHEPGNGDDLVAADHERPRLALASVGPSRRRTRPAPSCASPRADRRRASRARAGRAAPIRSSSHPSGRRPGAAPGRARATAGRTHVRPGAAAEVDSLRPDRASQQLGELGRERRAGSAGAGGSFGGRVELRRSGRISVADQAALRVRVRRVHAEVEALVAAVGRVSSRHTGSSGRTTPSAGFGSIPFAWPRETRW